MTATNEIPTPYDERLQYLIDHPPLPAFAHVVREERAKQEGYRRGFADAKAEGPVTPVGAEDAPLLEALKAAVTSKPHDDDAWQMVTAVRNLLQDYAKGRTP